MEMQITVHIKYTSSTPIAHKAQGKHLDKTQLWTQAFKMVNN